MTKKNELTTDERKFNVKFKNRRFARESRERQRKLQEDLELSVKTLTEEHTKLLQEALKTFEITKDSTFLAAVNMTIFKINMIMPRNS